jgi:photosystem II stability/assembly factor-like uncharacterized protein
MRAHWLILFIAVPGLAFAQSPIPAPTPWQMQESGTAAGLRGIDSVDGTVAWASGTGGTVLRTIDGGAHWTKCVVPDGEKDGATLDFRGVQARDANTAIVMASGKGILSRLYKTIDGCKTWKMLFQNPESPNGFFDSFRIFNFRMTRNQVQTTERFGFLLGDPVNGKFAIYESRDGGDSWTRIPDDDLSASAKESGAFAASNSCISGFGGRSFGIVVNDGLGASILRLMYSGAAWLDDPPTLTRHWSRRVALPIAVGSESAGPFSLSMISRPPPLGTPGPFLFAVVVDGDYLKPNESTGTAAWSADGGEHWTASTTPPHGFRSAVQWSDDLKVWITVGTNGSDVSRDDGKTWQPLDNGNWNALSLPFVVGPNGRIARLNPAAIANAK